MSSVIRPCTPHSPLFDTVARRLASLLILSAAAALAISLPSPAQAGGVVEIPFDPDNFSEPLTINNPLHPLVAGKTFTYFAEGDDGCEWDVVIVTTETRAVAAGVTGRVVRDLAYEDEACNGYTDAELVERTDDWFAQDDDHNVWYLGEYSEDCNGAGNCTVSDGSWEAGVYGAVAGIIMLASPKSGEQYFQEFYEGFAEDEATVLRGNAWISLYYDNNVDDDYQHCLVTKESTKLAPGEVEQKYHCPDVGLVMVEEHRGKTLRFELFQITP